MSSFKIETVVDPENNPFDRQERIEWWSQEKINNAKIMVVGAGAIGNETLKNLALLGVRNVFVVDFDNISKSNLSRTVLFRKSDVGKKKAEIAAKRMKELCLANKPNIDWYHGDIVWDLGTSIYKEMTLVLGCLDNVETRFAVNRQCWLAQTPWIDSGINELGLHVSLYRPPDSPCYRCGTTKAQREAERQRYSCDQFRRTAFQEGKTPTVQISSAIASAIQVQEAMKYICGQQVSFGKKIYFQGTMNDLDINALQYDPYCLDHVSYPRVTALPISSSMSLQDFLVLVSSNNYSGKGAVLDLEGERFTFVVSSACRSCGDAIEFYKPAHLINDTDAICDRCRKKGIALYQVDQSRKAEQVLLTAIGVDNAKILRVRPDQAIEAQMKTTDRRILDMQLHQLGIPFGHIVSVKDGSDNYGYYEITQDKEELIPNILKNNRL